MIPFNRLNIDHKELHQLKKVFKKNSFQNGGSFTKNCEELINKTIKIKKTILTHSCTGALEMSAILSNINIGDQIIIPSNTFSSTANAFALRGAELVFSDCSYETLNIEPSHIEKLITKKTKCIVVVHYAGISCDMDPIIEIAKNNNCFLVEDAAQAYMSKYKNKMLGSLGDFGTFSFHQTKNIISGEGGALLINNKKFIKRAIIIKDKGTDRDSFLQGNVDKYTWKDIGSSYGPNELTSAFLFAQLKKSKRITNKRLIIWNKYYKDLKLLEKKEKIKLPMVPKYAKHNGHMFYVLLSKEYNRAKVIDEMKLKGVTVVPHYTPLHSSIAGKKYGSRFGNFKNTNMISKSLLRLPLFDSLKNDETDKIINALHESLKS